MSLRLFSVAPSRQMYRPAAAVSRRHGDVHPAREVSAREGLRGFAYFLRRALKDDIPTLQAGAGTHVDDVVGGKHHFRVVFDYEDGVAHVPEALQRRDQPRVIPGVEADSGLVEDIENPYEAGTDLRSQPDPLPFSPRERIRRPLQTQIVHTHFEEEHQPRPDLPQYTLRDEGLLVRQLQGREKIHGLPDGHPGDLMDVLPPDRHGQALLFQPGTTAGRAFPYVHIPRKFSAGILRFCFPVPPVEGVDHPFKGLAVKVPPPFPVEVKLNLLVAGPVQEHSPDLFRQLVEGDIDVKFVMPGEGLQKLEKCTEFRFAQGTTAPSRMDSSGSETTRSSSKYILVPRPPQSGQAP